MKRISLIITLLVGGFSAALLAQPDPAQRQEKIKAFRIAIFTEALNLTAKEAEGFWPLYNEFLDRREELVKQQKSAKQLDGMSDQEVEEAIKKHFELRQKEIELERELYQKLRSVLPARKIAKLPEAERQFREAIFKKTKEKFKERERGN